MNKSEPFNFDEKLFKNDKKLSMLPIIHIVVVFFIFIIFNIFDSFNINKHIIGFSILILLIIVNSFNLIHHRKKQNQILEERKLWLIENEENLIKEEGIVNKYEIVDFTYLENKSDNKMNAKRTKGFQHELNLVEIIYLKDNKKYKVVIEAAILNDNPKQLRYIEFDNKGTFYRNGKYNVICE